MRTVFLRMNALVFAAIAMASAQSANAQEVTWEIYGAAQADLVQDFNRVDPNWDDTLRPSKIPTTEGVFGDDGQSIISARQSRFGLQAGEDLLR